MTILDPCISFLQIWYRLGPELELLSSKPPMAKRGLESDRRGEILGNTKACVLFPRPDPFQGPVQKGSGPPFLSQEIRWSMRVQQETHAPSVVGIRSPGGGCVFR